MERRPIAVLATHRGRVVKLAGDGLLVEFAGVVDALACAVARRIAAAECETGSSGLRKAGLTT